MYISSTYKHTFSLVLDVVIGLTLKQAREDYTTMAHHGIWVDTLLCFI